MLSESYFHTVSIKRMEERFNDPVFISVARGKPRYINAETFRDRFEWNKDLAPSQKLLNEYNAGLITWDEYVPRFEEEMKKPTSKDALLDIVKRAENENIILFCHEGPKAGTHCHRFLLLDMCKVVADNNWIRLRIVISTEMKKTKTVKRLIDPDDEGNSWEYWAGVGDRAGI